MAVPISNVVRRIVFAPSGVGPYSFTFEILAATDIQVFKGDTLLTLTTNYTVNINANGTGSITLVATAGSDSITIVGARTIQRTTDFVTGGDLFANSLNDELDSLTIFAQQNSEGVSRALQIPQTDPVGTNIILPRAADRANKFLSFDSSGNASAAVDIGNVAGVNALAADIALLADIEDGTIATNSISNLAIVASEVADVAAAVTEVKALGADLNGLPVVLDYGDLEPPVNPAAPVGVIGSVFQVLDDIQAVAGIAGGVSTVAENIDGILNAADNIAEVVAAKDAAEAAQVAAEAAQAAAENAEDGTVNFQTSVAVVATSLAAGESATVEYTSGTTTFTFGIPAGATGPAGETGPTGAAGPTGDAGLTWRDAYDNATVYEVNDAVSFSGSSFICIQASTGNLPSNTAFWSLLAEKGADGELSLAGTQTLTNKTIDGANNTLTNISLETAITGTLPVANGGTGITSLGTGVATFLGTPSSANLAAAVTDETGTGVAVFGTNPTLTGVTLAGEAACADNLVTRATLKDYAVQGSAIGATGATRTFDMSVANFFSATLDQACVFTFSNPPASGDFGCFVLELTDGGDYAITFPASVDFVGGVAPTLSATGVDQLVFTTRDGGTTFFAFVAGLDIKSP